MIYYERKRGIISWLMLWETIRVLPLGDNNGNHGNHIAMVTRYICGNHATRSVTVERERKLPAGQAFPTQLHTLHAPHYMNLSHTGTAKSGLVREMV